MIEADLSEWLSVIPNDNVTCYELTLNVLLDAWSYAEYACRTTREVDNERVKRGIPSIYGGVS